MAVRVELRRDAGKLGFPPDPWIRRRSVARVQGPPDPAALACVVDHRDRVLGWGSYSPESDICVRLIQLGEAPPPPSWLADRLAGAFEARGALGLGEDSTGYREVNSEGDGLPGLVIDRYGDLLVAQLTTAPMVVRRPELLALIEAFRPGAGVLLLQPAGAAKREGFPAECSFVRGGGLSEAPTTLEYLEHGARFSVPAPPAQKTGGYHDQRDNRRRIAALLAPRGGRMLDLGCHVGGFSIHAALAHPQARAVAVDRSTLALDHLRRNAEANGVAARVEAVEADIFGPLDHPQLAGPFDLVVFDPPKIANSRRDLPRAVAAMQRTLRTILPRLAPGGQVALCSCSHVLDHDALDRVASGAAAALGQLITRTTWLGPGLDHPVAPGHTQGEYLRVGLYQPRS